MTLLRIAVATLLLQAAQQTPIAPASLEGVVVQKGSGDPLAKVTVLLTTPTGRLTATTGTDGRFAFRSLLPGPHLLTASRPGYAFNAGHDSFSDNILVQAGQRLTGFQLQLSPTGSISGRIVDRKGEPMTGAVVHAQRLIFDNGTRNLVSVQSVTANDLGEYRLFWLPPGQYTVAVLPAYTAAPRPTIHLEVGVSMAAAYAFVGDTLVSASEAGAGAAPGRRITSRIFDDGTVVEEGSVPVYYPATTNPDTATRLDVRPGSSLGGIDIMAAPVAVFSVRGTVVNGVTGLPEAPASVSIRPRSAINIVAVTPGASTIAGNRFEITGVPSGSYFVVAELRGGAVRQYGIGSIDVGSSNLENVTITTNPLRVISGRVIVEGSPPAGTPVSGGNRATQVILRVNGRTGAEFATMSYVGPDGTFKLPAPVPGEAQISVKNPPEFFGYVKSIRLGSSDGLLGTLRLDGPPAGQMEIVVSANAGRLEGTVVDDRREPVSNVAVVLIPDGRLRQRFDAYSTATTDRTGRFNMRGISPGTYRVFAWEDVENGIWFDPEFMRSQEALGRPVSFTEGSAETIELRMIPYR